jgi:RNA polymerase sigma-70 factor (ECF subfamily)
LENPRVSLENLVERCNSGDGSAWDEFYARYHPLVSSVARRLCSREPEDVEDTIQEVFINLFRALQQYDPSRSLEAYIVEIARRVRISRYRMQSAAKRGGAKRVLTPPHSSELSVRGSISVAATEKDQESALIRAQETRFLRKALTSISDRCRNLLAMRYDQDLSYKEMAAILGEKEGTLRVQVQRCLSSLSRRYEDLAVHGVKET